MNIPFQDSRRTKRPPKKVVRYKECLRNHATIIGGNATNGCGEFIRGG